MSTARSTSFASLCTTPPPAVDEQAARQNGAGAAEPTRIANVVIATISRLFGDTGVQTHSRSLRDGLVASGTNCVIQTPHKPIWWEPIFGVRHLFGRISPSWSTRWYRRYHASALCGALGRRLRRQRVDAILAQCPVSASVAMSVRQRLGLRVPIVMACHFNYSEAKEYRDKGELTDEASYREIVRFEERVLGEVDHIIYVSSWAKRVVEQERGIAVRGSTIIWNGIASTVNQPAVSRQSLGLSPDDLVLINVGTLEKRKNQLGLIDLFARVANEWPKARLLLVGDGPQRGEIRERISQLELGEKVIMLGMRRDVPAILPAADIYLHYSALENCPVVLIEAARASLPVTAVPGGGVPELLQALGGMAIDSQNHAAAVETLRPLMNSAAARQQAGAASRAAFDAVFTREAMVRAYLKAFESATTPRAAEVKP